MVSGLVPFYYVITSGDAISNDYVFLLLHYIMETKKKLMKEKPSEKYNNPQDEEEIRVAKATLGYFHLKTSSDYVVPEHLRSNTRQKRRKIANMTIQIYNQKKVFNEKVRKARDEKIAIRSEIISLTDQISKVSSRLGRG